MGKTGSPRWRGARPWRSLQGPGSKDRWGGGEDDAKTTRRLGASACDHEYPMEAEARDQRAGERVRCAETGKAQERRVVPKKGGPSH